MTTKSVAGTGETFHALGEALEARRQRIQEGILTWSANNLPRYPWRQQGRTPYEVLVGEAWLKLTSSTLAVRIYQRFVQQFLSVKALADAEEDNVAEICRNFGLGRSAEYIKMMIKRLLKEGKGCLPSDSETFARTTDLEKYHIQAIFCFGYGMPIAIVDNNVARMLSRLFRYTLPSPPTPGFLQAIGENLLPFGNHQSYNCGLLDLAELICRSKNPLCPRCPVDEFCDYADSLPQNSNPYPVLRDYVTA